MLLLGLAALAALILMRNRVTSAIPALIRWVHELGPFGVLGFIAVYTIAAVAFVPGSVLSLAGGAIFGVLQGTIYVFVGASLGATAAFAVSRWLARRAVERRLAQSPRFAAIDRAVAAEGLKIAFLLRLSPVVPFNLLNYSLGITRMAVRDYVLALPGMIPAILLYVYYGKVGADLAELAGPGRVADRGSGAYVVLVIGLVATAVATFVITRAARRALQQQLNATNEMPVTDPRQNPPAA